MPTTLREARELTAHKLGGFRRELITIGPEVTDALAQRSILCSELFDADAHQKKYENQFAWVGKYKDQRRARAAGYRSLAYVVYVPPTSGTYTILFYGYGQTTSLAFNASASTVQTAVNAITGLSGATATQDGTQIVISLPSVIDAEISEGTMISQGGIGAVEVNRGFTKALRAGDEFELHTKLPVRDSDNVQGLNTLINIALDKMWFIDKFPITPIRNSRGMQTFLGLTNERWLFDKKQIIALYNPTYWRMSAVLTPPESGTYTLQMFNGVTTSITSSLAYNASGSAIQSALVAASGLPITVSPSTVSSSYTVVLPETHYAVATLTTSSGTVVHTRTMLESPSRYSTIWNFQYDGESPYLDNIIGEEGYSILVEAHRQASTWVCPQASYGVLGDTWMSTTVGLVDDYDMAVPTAEDIAKFAYAEACRQLVQVGPANEQDHWRNELLKADRLAATNNLWDSPQNYTPRGGTGGLGWGSKGVWL